LAALAADTKDRGEKPLPMCSQSLTEAAKLDPEHFFTWVHLSQLSAGSW
jgi:hypothetical protein